VAIALRMAAQAVGRTQSPLGLFYRRIKGRIGGQGAVTATAHELAVLVYRMLKFGTEYVKRSVAEYEVKLRASLERRLRAKAAKLGFELVPRCATTAP
jgi:transposase